MTPAPDPMWDPPPGAAGRPLSGIRVLDVSRVVAGPYCAMLLGDLGATVIKVEGPQGDETRRWGPPFHNGTASYFYAANRNKRGLRLDLSRPPDRARLQTLLEHADVLVHNFTGRVLAKFHLTYEEVAAANPTCIHCAISGFGPEQPDRRGFDVVAQAMGGMMAVTGSQDGPPTKVGVPISDLAAGLFSALAVTACLRDREVHGAGAQVEVSLLDSVVALLANQAMAWLAEGVEPTPLGNDHPQISPYGLYSTGSGGIVIAAGTDSQFAALCHELGAPELAQDPRFASNRGRVGNRSDLRDLLEALLARADAERWQVRLEGAGIPCGVVRSVSEVFTDVGARLVRSVDGVPQVMAPFRLDGKYLVPFMAPPEVEPTSYGEAGMGPPDGSRSFP
ncbi:MAG: CaiB/BaiF CoA transferase family protein [Candidatus Dormibacteria bacterium]